MTKAYKRWGLAAALILVAGGLLALAAPTAARAAAPGPKACSPLRESTREGHIAGIIAAVGKCPVSNTSDVANGTPPLLFHGGKVMGTPRTGPVVLTPIFWSPAGYPMSIIYRQLIQTYIGYVGAASGQQSNVYSVLQEYYGINGHIRYQIRLGMPIYDSDALPASGCQVASTDTSGIYADGSGYSACLDDTQVQAEVNHVTATRGLPHNLSHIYIMYLPKHVESCFLPGQTTSTANGQACTINYQPTAAYCAYHNYDPAAAVYANMPYPIYYSGTGFTCGTEVNFGVVESPNGNPDADVEISPTSHEVSEAITDPDTVTGWYDSSGYEIGDECAYIFGPTQGAPGHLYNQVIDGMRFLTQEEFSNHDFFITGGGCVQSARDEA